MLALTVSLTLLAAGSAPASEPISTPASAAVSVLAGSSPAAVTPAGSSPAASVFWQWPVWPYPTVVRAFDPPAEPWLAGHRGVDLDVTVGAPVRAPAAGTVSYSGTVAGRGIVTVQIGKFKSTVLPVDHRIEQGQPVHGGEVIGKVAATPQHCPGRPCLHWGVRRDGAYVNPLDFVTDTAASVLLPLSRAPRPRTASNGGSGGTGGSNRWGGFANGRIPAGALCPIRHAPGQRLRCDAARSMVGLDRAFRARFGTHIGITDAYRDYSTQVLLKRTKGYLAAPPGTSNHGWGVAVDFGSGINRFGSAAYRWMRARAATFGWHHPSWADQGSRKPEPWHWEFG